MAAILDSRSLRSATGPLKLLKGTVKHTGKLPKGRGDGVLLETADQRESSLTGPHMNFCIPRLKTRGLSLAISIMVSVMVQ